MMALRRAVPATSTRLLSRSTANSNVPAIVRGGSTGARLMPTSSALLHSSGNELSSLDAGTALKIPSVAASSRGFASAMPAESAAEERTHLKYFRPVEKLANGVAVVRWVFGNSL